MHRSFGHREKYPQEMIHPTGSKRHQVNEGRVQDSFERKKWFPFIRKNKRLSGSDRVGKSHGMKKWFLPGNRKTSKLNKPAEYPSEYDWMFSYCQKFTPVRLPVRVTTANRRNYFGCIPCF
ncbi:hypothetical protein NPIL_293551 [Nephila pilipes]|uniref:Uncharacterized protein n=1 Tax=Nephila pilipes TaxID=299642 RepID=A0A8X6NX78_NEPPI|nr:hypothetical protein NPIL_293551 [Nephila pilipes]